MADVDALPPKERKSVSEQLASFMVAMNAGDATLAKSNAALPKGGKATPKAKVATAKPKPSKLAESFIFVAISLTAVVKPPEDLAELLEPQGHWLHLVRTGTKATHFAISDSLGFDDTHKVMALTEGILPQAIFDAIKWVDAKDKAKLAQGLVRVVAFPALFCYALCILRKDGPTAVRLPAPPDEPTDAGPKSVKVAHVYEEVPLGKLLNDLKEPAQAVLKYGQKPHLPKRLTPRLKIGKTIKSATDS